jgi:malonate transporter and related proteins
MIETLIFITTIVLPVFLIVIIGVILKQLKIVDDIFIKSTSHFVFYVALPVLIFMKLYDVDIGSAFDLKMILLVVFGIIATFLVAFLVARYFKLTAENEGVFVQGSFRSNFAIVSLAIIIRMYGTDVAAKAAFLLLFAMPLYNLLAIVALTIPFYKSKNVNYKNMLKEIASNPLLIAVVAAIVYSFFNIGLHTTLVITGNYLSDTALPVALLGIGGSLNIESLKEASAKAIGAAFIKNILSPSIVTIIAYHLGVKGTDLGVLFLIFASPTAIASFVMAAGMKGNIKLAGNIIIVSTFGSIFTIIFGLFILNYLGLV